MVAQGFDTAVEAVAEGLPVTLRPRLGITRVRKVYEVAGFGPDLKWGVHNNSLRNFMRGLVERVYCIRDEAGQLVPPPIPREGAFEVESLRLAREQVLRHLQRTPRVDTDVFLSYYSGRQRAVYDKAALSLLTTPVRRADARVKSFVKAEKINRTSKPDPAPRVIQPRDPRYNIEVGRFLRPLEKPMFDAIKRTWGGPTVLKCNYAQQGEALREMWEQFPRPVAVGLDASRFDQHVSAAALRYEHSFYLSAFRGPWRQTLARLLQWQIDNRGVAYFPDGRVTYEVEGKRMSGDINTSLGNCVLMCCLVWAYCHERGVKARLANNGDDCVVIMDESHLAQFSGGLREWFLERGFNMTVEDPVRDFERIVFCQTQPVWTPQGWIMCRDPRVAIGKDLVSMLDLGEGLRAYLGSIGMCGEAAAGGLPVFGEFYQQCSTAGRITGLTLHRAFASGLLSGSKGMNRRGLEVSDYTRYSFWLAFGILPDEQVALEMWLKRHPPTAGLGYSNTKPYPSWYTTRYNE